MQERDKILTKKIFKAEKKLKVMSSEKRTLSIKLSAKKKSIEELKLMDSKIVYHKIDSVLIPRERDFVIEDIQEEIKLLKEHLKEIDNVFEKEMKSFKRLVSNRKARF